MREKFIVQHYFCDSETLTNEMNRMYEKNYYPKEIKLEPYQNKIMGFIIFELEYSK